MAKARVFKHIDLLPLSAEGRDHNLAKALAPPLAPTAREARITYNALATLHNTIQPRYEQAAAARDTAAVDAMYPVLETIEDMIERVLVAVEAYIDDNAGDASQIDAINKRLDGETKAVTADTADYNNIASALDDLKSLIGLAASPKAG